MQDVSGGLIGVTQYANEHCKQLPTLTGLSLDGPLVNRRPSIKEDSWAQVQHYQRQLVCLWQPPTVL